MQIRHEYFERLEVWQLAFRLTKDVYRITRSFPAEERFGLLQQLQRAAVGIMTNIAEGHARGTSREYLQFCLIARGSQTEMHALLMLSRDLAFIDEQTWIEISQGYARVGQMLNRLIRSLRRKASL